MKTKAESDAMKSTLKDANGDAHDNVDDDTRPPDDLAPPPPAGSAPEGGYGWVIVFASFMSQVIVDGTAFSFGVFSEEIEVHFSSSSGKTFLVGSVLSGTYLMTAPLASVLTNRYGYRPVTIAGSLIGTLGFGVSALSSSIDTLLVTFGVIGGFGLGLIYLPGIVAVSEYFDRRRPLTTGIVVCGSGVGCFLFAPLFNFLLDEMGWKYSVVILSGITLNGCVFGALLRPLPNRRDVKSEKKNPRRKNVLDRVGEALRIRKASVSSDTKDALSFAWKREELRLEKEEKLKREEAEAEEADLEAGGKQDRQFRDNGSTALSSSVPGSRRRIDASRRSSTLVSTSLLHIAYPVDGGISQKDHAVSSVTEARLSRRDVFLRVTGIYLLADPLFCIPCLANLFAMVGLFIPFYFISLRASQLPDTDGTKAAFLLSVIAIFNTGGRLLVGFVAGFKRVSSLLIHNIALVTGGVACILSMFCVNYWLTCIYAAYFGLCVAAWISLTSIILCDLLGVERLSNSFGILTLVRGVSTLIGPPIAGNVYDSTHDYNNSFHVGGVMLLSGGLVCCLLHLPSLQRRKFSKKPKDPEEETKVTEREETRSR